MKLSTDRILTTHAGSLPRESYLLPLVQAQDRGETVDEAAFDDAAARAVKDIVAKQMAAGIDVVCDGEQAKASYTHYVKFRLSGLHDTTESERDRHITRPDNPDDVAFPDFAAERAARTAGRRAVAGVECRGDVAYVDRAALEADLARFAAAVAEAKPVDTFLTAASPGVITGFIPNAHYASEDAYLEALAEAMRTEYEAIHAAGFGLQIDSPDVAMTRNSRFADKSDAEFVRIAARNVEAVNHATRNIPREAMRLHLCWGNFAGPHAHDIEVRKLFDVVFAARPQAISFEGANPRHEHEWEDWKGARIPDDTVLIPGVVDSTSNFVEHPRLVAQRIRNYADIVGRERVIAGTDCGFGTFAGPRGVYETVIWAKLKTIADGAAIASKSLWS